MKHNNGELEVIQYLTDLPRELLRVLLAAESPPEEGKEKLVKIAKEISINWKTVSAEANNQKVGVLLYKRLQDLGLTQNLDEDIERSWQADCQHAQVQEHIQDRDAVTISKTLSHHGIRHSLIKGFVYRRLYYDPPWVRLSADTDMLIDRHNIEKTRRLMQAMGFTQAACTQDYRLFRPAAKKEIQKTEAEHYELAQFVKSYNLSPSPDWVLGSNFKRRLPFLYEKRNQKLLLHSLVDVHWAIHFVLADGSPLENTLSLEGDIPILRPEWNLLTSCFKLYFEAFDKLERGLHQLVDIAAILKKERDKIEWDFFQHLIERYDFRAAAFYTLSAAVRLAGESLVPREILWKWSRFPATASSTSKKKKGEPRHSALDFGDFTPYMLGRLVPGAFLTKSAD